MSNRVKKKEDCVRVSYSFKKTEDFVHQIKSEEGKKRLCVQNRVNIKAYLTR